jgi:hypothetical protein
MGQYNHFSLAVQEEITPKTLFEVAWVGNNALHLQATDDFNDPTPGAGAVQGRRPYQPWEQFQWSRRIWELRMSRFRPSLSIGPEMD